MKVTKLRQRYGYMVGISASYPLEVALALDAEVARRNTRGEHGARGAGHPVVVADVLREVLVRWARAGRGRAAVRWWAWREATAHARRGGSWKALCGHRLDQRACLDLGVLRACPECLAALQREHAAAVDQGAGPPATTT